MRSTRYKTCILGSLVWLLSGCDDGQNQSKNHKTSPSPGESTENFTYGENVTYGEKSLVNTWPGEASGSELAANLTARNYYLVVDGSGSMAESECSNGKSKIDVAEAAIKRFLNELPGDANVGLYVFDYKGENERVPLGEHQLSAVKSAVDSIDEGGGTPLSTAIEAGYVALTAQARRQLGYGEYHLVVVTDGYASTGYSPDAILNTLLAESPVIVHGIGFCVDEDHSLNLPGKTYFTSARNPESLAAGLSSVLSEAPGFSDTSWSKQ